MVLAGFTASFCTLSAQTSATLDLHTKHSKNAFYVVLASRAGSATGHAFVVWGIEDARHHRTMVRALGLYPESNGTNCNSVLRTVPGGILDELKTHSFQSIDQKLILRVDESVYKRSLQVARQWDCQHEFSLLNRDCVDFLRAVGLSLDLDMPERRLLRSTPQAYMRSVLEKADHGSLAHFLAAD